MRLNCIELIGALIWRKTGASEDEFIFEYSTDNGESWQNWEQDSQIEGYDYQPVLIRGDNAGKDALGTYNEWYSPNVTFSATSNNTYLYGNIAALYDYNLEADIPDWCFGYLFKDHGDLVHGPGFAKGENQNVGSSVLSYTYKGCWSLKQLDPILSEEAVNNNSIYTFKDCEGVQTLRFGREPWKDTDNTNSFYFGNGFFDDCWSSGTIYHRDCEINDQPGNWTDVSRDGYEDYFKIVALTDCSLYISNIRDDFEWSYDGIRWYQRLKSQGQFDVNIGPDHENSMLMFRYDGLVRPFPAIRAYYSNNHVKMSGTFTSLYDSFDASIDNIYMPDVGETLFSDILGEASLVVKPEIRNEPLDIYNYAFSDNPGLSSFEVIGITSWDQLGQHYGWLQNVSPTGVFKRPSDLPEPEQYGISTIPVGWRVLPPYRPETPYFRKFFIDGKEVSELFINGTEVKLTEAPMALKGLAFKAKQNGSTVALTKIGAPADVNLEYAINSNKDEDF